MVHHANMLLEQIIATLKHAIRLFDQYIGVWKVGFKPQLMMREYLTRRGNAQLRKISINRPLSAFGYELII
jgi:hypothetical protein